MRLEKIDKKYWEKYYKSSLITQEEIIRICGSYDSIWERMRIFSSKNPSTIIEIGAYPGRFLAYLSSKYSLEATALDYNPDSEKIRLAFDVMKGSILKEIIQTDFLQYNPSQSYDIVLSNGFIEHFDNYDMVLDRHVLYLNKGGVLMMMIPNKRHLRKLYGYLVDYKNLKVHNLRSMNLQVFRSFALRNGLQIRYLSYYGGFPYRVHQGLNLAQKIIYKTVRAMALVVNPLLENHPNRFWSGTIIAILTKEDA